MEEKDLKKLTDAIDSKIEEVEKLINTKAGSESLENIQGELAGKIEALETIDSKPIAEYVKQVQEHTNGLEQKIKDLQQKQGRKIVPVSAQLLESLQGDDFRNAVKAARSGNKSLLRSQGFEIKAANIDTDDINSGTIETQTDAGVGKAPWRPTPIYDAVAKGTVGQGRDSISWWEETTRTDSAELVAEENAPSSGSAKTFTKQSMSIYVIKDYTKVSEEALEDFEYMMSEINDLMQNGVPREREAYLLSGSGSSQLKGIDEYYQTFAKPANFDSVANPNVGDVLAAAILQCQNGNTSDTEKKGFQPNLIMLNPGDATNMRLVKNAVESYVAHPMLDMGGQSFSGIRIATSLDLSAGQFIVGDFSRAKYYTKRGMRVSFHYENEDDVLNGLVLVLASERGAGLKVSTPEAYAFVGGTISAGKELITAS